MRTRAAVLMLLAATTGCASMSKAKAAEAMQCPEAELVPGYVAPKDNEGAKMLAALVLLPLVPYPVVPIEKAEVRWAGCGKTFECAGGECSETAQSRALRLSRAVPALMEKSLARLGAGATAEQVGYFTWDMRSPRGETHCRVLTEELFRCHPDLEGPAPKL